MKVLVVHNFYQMPGGEDRVFEDECGLLESHGHEVVRFTKHNDQLADMGSLDLLKNTIWNRTIEQELIDLLRRELPDVMHCHNTFPLISPAAYYAAKQQGVAVVQTLHNYRLLCPAATLLRNGQVCEKCVGRSLTLPAIQHGCYRNSRAATAATTAMLAVHRYKKTWTEAVDRYIALTEFSRQKFIEGGLPADRIVVKPNLVEPDPGMGSHDGANAVFVGRLSAEKGIETLLDAWEQLPDNISLKIAGDGPLADRVQDAAARDDRIEWLGHVANHEVCELIGQAHALVMPSVCYETFGRTIIEAFAAGTPVIASRTGAMQELIEHGRTGLLFEAGSSHDLVVRLQQLWHDSAQRDRMSVAARHTYEDSYTAEPNYQQLIDIYHDALAVSGSPVESRQTISAAGV